MENDGSSVGGGHRGEAAILLIYGNHRGEGVCTRYSRMGESLQFREGHSRKQEECIKHKALKGH